MTTLQRILGLSILVAATLAPLRASADVQACLGASDKGQRARSAGRLREAREMFLVCSAEGCPALVRRDCAQWQSEVVAMLPGVVFGAKDKQGRDLFDVNVSMDGELLLRKLDGKTVAVDPGPHTFKFEVPGSPPHEERALVKEGEKSRVITVTFKDIGASAGDGATSATNATNASSTSSTDRSATPAPSEGGHTVYPWILVGMGVVTVAVGAVYFATSPSLPAGCVSETKTCTKLPGETSTAFAGRQSDAGASDSQPRLGLIIGGTGLVVIAGGLLWHFLEPSKSSTSGSLKLTPWAGPGSAGGSLGASF